MEDSGVLREPGFIVLVLEVRFLPQLTLTLWATIMSRRFPGSP